AAIVDRVLEPRVHAVAAVAEIALDPDDVLRDRNHVLRLAVSDRRREPRIRLWVTVRHAEPAADRDVVPDDLVALGNRDEAEVLPEDVDVVQRRHDEADLELAGQVRLPVKRLLVVARLGLRRTAPELA